MIDKDTLDAGNKLICEFMGLVRYNEDNHPAPYGYYDKEWNYLMPVCKKFESLPDSVNFNKNDYNKWVENSECLGAALWGCEIVPVWEVLVRAINWYINI